MAREKAKKTKGKGGELTYEIADKAQRPAETPRLWGRYKEEICAALMKEFGYDNVMQVPKLEKITLNMGLGEAVGNPNIVPNALNELSRIAGQKAVATRAKKSISNFKLREGVPIGCMVTLRRERMWEFLDRLDQRGRCLE